MSRILREIAGGCRILASAEFWQAFRDYYSPTAIAKRMTDWVAAVEADAHRPDGYCSCRGLPERTCGIRLHRLSAGADR